MIREYNERSACKWVEVVHSMCTDKTGTQIHLMFLFWLLKFLTCKTTTKIIKKMDPQETSIVLGKEQVREENAVRVASKPALY
jgi:hypothetical protein